MAFPYKHFLVIGATAGIGKALATRLVESGAKVTVVGRRQDRLDEFVQTVGAAHAKGERFDIGELAQIPDFAARYDVFPEVLTRSFPHTDRVTGNTQGDGGVAGY